MVCHFPSSSGTHFTNARCSVACQILKCMKGVSLIRFYPYSICSPNRITRLEIQATTGYCINTNTQTTASPSPPLPSSAHASSPPSTYHRPHSAPAAPASSSMTTPCSARSPPRADILLPRGSSPQLRFRRQPTPAFSPACPNRLTPSSMTSPSPPLSTMVPRASRVAVHMCCSFAHNDLRALCSVHPGTNMLL